MEFPTSLKRGRLIEPVSDQPGSQAGDVVYFTIHTQEEMDNAARGLTASARRRYQNTLTQQASDVYNNRGARISGILTLSKIQETDE